MENTPQDNPAYENMYEIEHTKETSFSANENMYETLHAKGTSLSTDEYIRKDGPEVAKMNAIKMNATNIKANTRRQLIFQIVTCVSLFIALVAVILGVVIWITSQNDDDEITKNKLMEKLEYLEGGLNQTEFQVTQLKLDNEELKNKLNQNENEQRKTENKLIEMTKKLKDLEVLVNSSDCASYRERGIVESGVYNITTRGFIKYTFPVYCDMQTSGGGWIVLQRRMDGSVNFYRNWHDYENGFGQLNSEMWLGNDKISAITATEINYKLRIDMETWDGRKRYAEYNLFSINKADEYRLTLGTYSGDAGDSLTKHNRQKFSTFDQDNDSYASNCALSYKGAWWYYACHTSNLNGIYNSTEYGQGINWYALAGHYESLKFTELKIRPVGYTPSS